MNRQKLLNNTHRTKNAQDMNLRDKNRRRLEENSKRNLKQGVVYEMDKNHLVCSAAVVSCQRGNKTLGHKLRATSSATISFTRIIILRGVSIYAVEKVYIVRQPSQFRETAVSTYLNTTSICCESCFICFIPKYYG
jgi:hypothetical protein